MRVITLFILCLLGLPLLAQNYTESDIKKYAEQINNKIKGVDLGNGVKARGCLSVGRKLIYQYEVPSSWQAQSALKEDIISNLRTSGAAKLYYLNNIDVDFCYYKGNRLYKKISVSAHEFSTFNFQLGDYISIKDHPKAKEVDLHIKVPLGWEVKEGDRPHIVKKFVYETNVYLVQIRENVTFLSREQSKKMLLEDIDLEEYAQKFTSFLENPTILDKSIVTVDNYPSIQIKAKGSMERLGLKVPVMMKSWFVFYEDKIIILQAMGNDNSEFRALESLYTMITNSVIFPEQYD
jgi:hypothetical protein